jgi:hypothetical protein
MENSNGQIQRPFQGDMCEAQTGILLGATEIQLQPAWEKSKVKSGMIDFTSY